MVFVPRTYQTALTQALHYTPAPSHFLERACPTAFRFQGDSTYHTLHSPMCRLLCSWSALPHGYLHTRPAPQGWWERNPAAGAQALQSHKPCQRQCIHNSLSQRHTPGPHLKDTREAGSALRACIRLHINLLGHSQSNLFFLNFSELNSKSQIHIFFYHCVTLSPHSPKKSFKHISILAFRLLCLSHGHVWRQHTHEREGLCTATRSCAQHPASSPKRSETPSLLGSQYLPLYNNVDLSSLPHLIYSKLRGE